MFKMGVLIFVLFSVFLQSAYTSKMTSDDLPTLYEYYTKDGINSGLEDLPDGFKLNGKNITIFSGTIHYFRVPPQYWRDRLRKARACGLNAVETYVPWNLHEAEKDKFDFGYGGNDMSPFLDVVEFIKIAQEEDLFVILRPGPYICAEWEFGGLPSWLLREPNMGLVLRTSNSVYEKRVSIYLSNLLPLVKNLQFTKGGPIIIFQIENEYGGANGNDKQYLKDLHQMMLSGGIEGLFVTSDNPIASGSKGSTPGALMTANFNDNPETQLNKLKELQPNKPIMVMEYWSGWFDFWFGSHSSVSNEVYSDKLERIIKFPSSVNIYMFHGGTNFGFLNGANLDNTFPLYKPIITSYDYDAPLTESGDYSAKYNSTKNIINQYNPIKTKVPDPPQETVKTAYPSSSISQWISYNNLIDSISETDKVASTNVINMEQLDINNGNGQSYGFTLYRRPLTEFKPNSTLKIKGTVRDMAIVLVEGERKTQILTNHEQVKGFGYWIQEDSELEINDVTGEKILDILVENLGRSNFGVVASKDFDQRKGIWDGVSLNNIDLSDWQIYGLQFKRNWIKSLSKWEAAPQQDSSSSPGLYKAIVVIDGQPNDTFLDMSGWSKGIVFVNGFNIGRYFNVGPPQTLFVPAPLLNEGENEIAVFELFTPSNSIKFTKTPIL